MKYTLFYLAVALTGFALAPESEAQQNSDRSVQSGNQPVVVNMTNSTKLPITILWVDFNGRAQNYGNLTTGQTMRTQTYPGHLWVFSQGGASLGSYRATTLPNQTYTIRQTVNSPVPLGTPRNNNGNSSNMTTPGQVVGGLLQRLIDKKRGNNTNPGGTSRTTTPSNNNSPPTRTTQPSQSITNTGSAITTAEAKQMVDFHNKVRGEVGVGQVTWSPQIAQFAQQWADHLASTGQFAHRPNSQQKYGENLAGGMGYANPVANGLQQWYSEKKLYRPAGAPFSMALMSAGHYSQMVWRGSTQIGAGKAVCRTGRYRGWTIIVCNYNPRGNMVGQTPY